MGRRYGAVPPSLHDIHHNGFQHPPAHLSTEQGRVDALQKARASRVEPEDSLSTSSKFVNTKSRNVSKKTVLSDIRTIPLEKWIEHGHLKEEPPKGGQYWLSWSREAQKLHVSIGEPHIPSVDWIHSWNMKSRFSSMQVSCCSRRWLQDADISSEISDDSGQPLILLKKSLSKTDKASTKSEAGRG
jgi:hypothetical protein